MKVPYGEGVAIHTGPESCGGVCEDMAEALAGESVGQVLSCERKYYFRMPTASICTEGNTVHCDNASNGLVLRGLRPWACTETFRTGTGRSRSRLRKWHRGPRRESERSTSAMNGGGKSDRSIVPKKPSNNGGPVGCLRRGQREGT